MSKDSTHYIIASEAADMAPMHIWAKSQQEAVEAFVNGENDYGYSAEFFDGYEVYVVPTSQITAWLVEMVPPPEPEDVLKISKAGKGI